MMITTKIQLPAHLKEYIIGKYNDFSEGPVRFQDSLDIYHYIYDLAQKRPVGVVDQGNLEIVLPARTCGKRPETYNYLSKRAQVIISKKIDTMFDADLHDFVTKARHEKGLEYNVAYELFLSRYAITSISTDGIKQNYYRWKRKTKKAKLSATASVAERPRHVL